MNGFVDSFFEYWRTRTKTQVYATFAFWWFVLHFEFFYTLLFVEQDKILALKHQLKNEYVWSYFIDYSSLQFWIIQGLLFILACLLTWFFIKIFPKLILNKAYSWERDNELDRQARKIEYEVALAEKKESLLDSQKRQAVSEKETQDIQEDINKKWRKDFELFKKDPAFGSFEDILKSIYENRGRIKKTRYEDGSGQVLSRIPSGSLALADGLGLINVDNDKERIELTDKGRYFVSKYPLGR